MFYDRLFLTKRLPVRIIIDTNGVLAQLGEHLLCTQGVRSSILLRSTIRYKKAMKLVIHRLFFLSAEPFFDDSDRRSASRGEKIVFSDKETGTIKTTRTRHHRFELFHASSTGTKGKILHVLSIPLRKNFGIPQYRCTGCRRFGSWRSSRQLWIRCPRNKRISSPVA